MPENITENYGKIHISKFVNFNTTLERMRRMIVSQAERKLWCTDVDYMLKRSIEEIKELDDALHDGSVLPEDAAKEAIDVFYFILQAIEPKCRNVNMNHMFLEKYSDNNIKKKKTIDENGKPVRR